MTWSTLVHLSSAKNVLFSWRPGTHLALLKLKEGSRVLFDRVVSNDRSQVASFVSAENCFQHGSEFVVVEEKFCLQCNPRLKIRVGDEPPCRWISPGLRCADIGDFALDTVSGVQ